MTNISDLMVSWLRTVVPAAWGLFLTWLLGVVVLPDALVEHISSELFIGVVTTLAIGAWYWIWRKVEPRIPAWLTRVVLGSNQAPTYVGDGEFVTDDPETFHEPRAPGEPSA